MVVSNVEEALETNLCPSKKKMSVKTLGKSIKFREVSPN